jgi:hypothetical protein
MPEYRHDANETGTIVAQRNRCDERIPEPNKIRPNGLLLVCALLGAFFEHFELRLKEQPQRNGPSHPFARR